MGDLLARVPRLRVRVLIQRPHLQRSIGQVCRFARPWPCKGESCTYFYFNAIVTGDRCPVIWIWLGPKHTSSTASFISLATALMVLLNCPAADESCPHMLIISLSGLYCCSVHTSRAKSARWQDCKASTCTVFPCQGSEISLHVLSRGKKCKTRAEPEHESLPA